LRGEDTPIRYEKNGVSLWYATQDAPAAEGNLSASPTGRLAGVRLAFAVKPSAARNTVEVRYRVNGGTVVKLRASLARSDVRSNAQYFAATLPEFKVGDTVEYAAVATWPKGQVPDEAEAAKFPTSFKVVPSGQTSAPKSTQFDARQTTPSDLPKSKPTTQTATAGVSGIAKPQLLALLRLARSGPSEIQKSDPSLGKYLSGKIAAERKSEILRVTRGGSKPFLDALQKIDYAPSPKVEADLRQVIEAGLTAQKSSAAIKREAAAKLNALERAGRLNDPAHLDLPIQRHPLFQPELTEAALYKLTDSVKLPDAKAERLATLAGSPALVDDSILASLVADKTLTAAEANDVGLLFSLCHLAGGDVDLAIEIKPRVAELPDIANVTHAQWLDAITRAKASSPDGITAIDYASVCRALATNIFPYEALEAANASDMRLLEQAMADLKPLAGKNDKIVRARFEDLDTGEVGKEQLPKLQAAHKSLQAFSNRHPGLGLTEVLDGKESPSEKISEISRRLDVLKKLRAQNSDQEFIGLDLTEGSADRKALKTEGLSDSDAHMAVAHLKAAQRLHAITKHVDHTSAILAAGYASGCEVAQDSVEDFRKKTGLDEGSSRTYHEKAKAALSRSSHAVVSAIDAYDGPFHRMPVGNVRSEVKDHLKSIPGFAELFGSQDYCSCSECESILGAPAYFVDLMTFIEENLTSRVFRGKKANNPLNLKMRRPDLWKLPLTCNNTNTLVSYLDIINPTLENYIAAQHLGYKGGLSDRVPIERLVYEEALAKSQASYYQPFTLPLECLDIYLEHFSTARGRIARALGADPSAIAMTTLRLSETVYHQINNATPDHEFLKRVHGKAVTFSGSSAHVHALNVKDLLSTTGYTRSDLEKAATTRFVTKDGAYKVAIHSEKSSPDSVQNDVEKISGLTDDALHRLYRFTRLLRVLPWTIAELDLILAQLEASGSTWGAEGNLLYHITQILDLRGRWSVAVDQLCALFSPIPKTPGGLLDRLFNFAPLARTDGPLPRPETKIVHAAFATSGSAFTVTAKSASPDSKDARQTFTARLLAGLQVRDAELVMLITSLAKPLGAEIEKASEIERGFALSHANLGLLFRHALLARLLNLRVQDLFQLIWLVGLTHGFVANLTDLMSLLEFHDWQQASGYTLDDLAQITRGPVQAPSHYPDPTQIANGLLNRVASTHSLEFADRVFMSIRGVTEAESQEMVAGNPTLFKEVVGAPTPTYQLTATFSPKTTLAFADTVFSFLPGITSDQSQQIVAANPTLFSAAVNSGAQALTLSASFSPTTVVAIPNEITLDPLEANAALAKYSSDASTASAWAMTYHPVSIIPSALAGLLSMDAGLLAACLTMTGVDLGSAEMFAAFQTPITVTNPSSAPPPPALLSDLVAKLVPLKVLFGSGAYTVEDLVFIQQHASLFQISDFNHLTIANARKLSVYQSFAANLINAGQTDASKLQAVLTSYSTTSHFTSRIYDQLAIVLNVSKHLLPSIIPDVALPATPPEALVALASLANIANRLGIGVEALKQIISEKYADQSLGVNALLAAFRAQFRSAREFTDRSQAFDNRIRARKRDALTDYLLSRRDPQFRTLDDLYKYFLLDVQLEGIMQTSWVVAAILSAQLYVYRCVMNLEQDDRDPSDPEHIEVKLGSEPLQEWEWRQNFRVWQANREVFLYPEAYILPELRDDKTPLFEGLESTLLQQPITKQNVLDAYSTYMTGFDQLSKLKIAGSYHDIDKVSQTDVLHLFGVTPDDPPTFYYRTIENASHGERESDRAVTYTPWEPVSLQIHCRDVAPIVYLGRLFVFWTHITTAPINIVNNANSIFGGYKHTWRVNYSSLRLDQTWTPPQRIAMNVVLDPLLDQFDKGLAIANVYNNPQPFDILGNYFSVFDGYDGNDVNTTDTIVALTTPSSSQTSQQKSLISNYQTNMGKFDSGFSSSDFTLAYYQTKLIPQYDNQVHTAAVDGYTLAGFQWDNIYPTLSSDKQELLLTGRNFKMRGDKVDFYNQVVAANGGAKVAEAQQTVICSQWDQKRWTTDIYTGIQHSFAKLDRYPWCSVVAKQAYIHKLGETSDSFDLYDAVQSSNGQLTYPLEQGLYREYIASIHGDPDIALINSSVTDEITDAIIDTGEDVLLLQANLRPGEFVMKRLTTTLGENLCRALFANCVDGLLSLDTQESFYENAPALQIQSHIQDGVVTGEMDFTGAMGTYFWEIFFHAPFLIADQLNSQLDYPDALQWYRFIFDPTAAAHDLLDEQQKREVQSFEGAIDADHAKQTGFKIEDTLKLGEMDAREKAKAERAGAEGAVQDQRRTGADRENTEKDLRAFQARARAQAEHDCVWRFIKFRGLDVPSLRAVLTDAAAIAAYEQDPFNPHAIARLRLSAYQKCIVMNYIDVLIEWGDALFTEFQTEPVNEATLLYVQALEILGPRPVEVGECGEGSENERTYEAIARTLGKGSQFLVEMETYTHVGTGAGRSRSSSRPQHQYVIDTEVANYYRKEALSSYRRRASAATRRAADKEGHDTSEARASGAETKTRHAPKAKAERGAAHPFHWKGHHGAARNAARGKTKKGFGRKQARTSSGGHASKFASSVVRHIGPAFCIPPDANLLAYWDLVEDRLYKIRHGMDITGALRQLSLFAPPINPMMLVEATAAGLSLDDVQSSTSGNVPPYRFTYLIDKAKQYASQVQGFGGALLSAIEKRDAQQLEVLRVTQQQNILAMTTATKQADVDSAQNAIDTLNAQLDTATFRHDYFQGLIEDWLNPWEVLELGAHVEAAMLHTQSAMLANTAGVLHLIPQLGSPFAMVFGGKNTGDATGKLRQGIADLASVIGDIANGASIQGGYERRNDGWQHEVDMANKDITQITTQLVGANTRLASAQNALAIHNKTITQNQQVADFYTSRFSNIALYTWLATTMQTTYRTGYTSAYAMAKLAEQAYRFERNDTTTILLPSDPYWSQTQSGLLSGEMLLGDLQNMERSFIETNYRMPEITQSFSMMQIDPAALLNLRQNASCNFSIPELCFDLFYPGQYCRKIKAVRITIPCVAGPLTNIGATLTLTASKLRLKASLDGSSLVPIQLNHSVVIATSTAQNDTGVFEFNFRDERYMPFEGAGAISSWKVELPSGFRQFDYQTISDVIVHISYTAQQDDSLRVQVEKNNGAIATALKSTRLARLFGLRQEFPSVLNRLLHSPINTPLTMSITPNNLPFFIASGAVQVASAKLLLRTTASKTVENFAVSIDGNSISGFATDPKMGGLWSSDASAAFASGLFADHTILVANAGNLAPSAASSGTPATVDDTSLLDVLVYVEYQLTMS
jgi:hypothetical protein